MNKLIPLAVILALSGAITTGIYYSEPKPKVESKYNLSAESREWLDRQYSRCAMATYMITKDKELLESVPYASEAKYSLLVMVEIVKGKRVTAEKAADVWYKILRCDDIYKIYGDVYGRD